MDNEIREYKSKSKSNRFPKLYLGLYEEFNNTFNKTYKNLKDNSSLISRNIPKSCKRYKTPRQSNFLIEVPKTKKKVKYHLKLLKTTNFDIFNDLNKQNPTSNEFFIGKSNTSRTIKNASYTKNNFYNCKKNRENTATTLMSENTNSLNSTCRKTQNYKNEDCYIFGEKSNCKKKFTEKSVKNSFIMEKIEDEKNDYNKIDDIKLKKKYLSRNKEMYELPIFLRDSYNIKGTNIISPFCIKARDEFLYKRIFNKSKPKIKKIWENCVDNKLNIFYAENDKQFKENIGPKLKRGMKKDGLNLINSCDGQLSEILRKSKFIKSIIDYAYPEMVLGRIREANKYIKISRNSRKNAIDFKAVDYEKRLQNKMITKNILEAVNIKKV